MSKNPGIAPDRLVPGPYYITSSDNGYDLSSLTEGGPMVVMALRTNDQWELKHVEGSASPSLYTIRNTGTGKFLGCKEEFKNGVPVAGVDEAQAYQFIVRFVTDNANENVITPAQPGKELENLWVSFDDGIVNNSQVATTASTELPTRYMLRHDGTRQYWTLNQVPKGSLQAISKT